MYMSQARNLGYGNDEMVRASLKIIVGRDTSGCAGNSLWLCCACAVPFPLERGSR